VPAQRGHPGGCRVCEHVERTRIELLLAGGAGQKAIARKFNVSKDSVHRHWHGHVSESRRAALIMGPVQIQALAAQVAEESGSVLDHHRAVRAGLLSRFHAALEAADNHAVAALAGRLTEVNNAVGRLTGQLAASPLIQNTTNTVNVFIHSPEFTQFQTDLIRVLSSFPEAREAVIAEFERLEASSAPIPSERAEQPALEHQPDANA
jgi:hypothetical protein